MRELYGLRWTPADALAFRAVVAASRAARPLTPRSALHGRCTSYFDDVAAAERARIESGLAGAGSPRPRRLAVIHRISAMRILAFSDLHRDLGRAREPGRAERRARTW